MKLYFISGLAADRRVFNNIRLPQKYEIIHLDWIKPQKNESLSAYSIRLAAGIKPGQPFALIGLSMGGMIACEIAKHHKQAGINKPAITILLSSVPVSAHLPAHFKFAGFFGLHKLIPSRFLKSASVLNRFFSADNKADKAILTQVIKDSDPVFIRWAMKAILEWKNETIPQPFCQIHGTKDRILPLRYTKPTHILNRGSHLMVMSRAEELSKLIGEALLSVDKS